jgi:hypothetical protein
VGFHYAEEPVETEIDERIVHLVTAAADIQMRSPGAENLLELEDRADREHVYPAKG